MPNAICHNCGKSCIKSAWIMAKFKRQFCSRECTTETKQGERVKQNKIEIFEDFAEIIIESKSFGTQRTAIDLDDVDKVKNVTWCLTKNSQGDYYIKGRYDGKKYIGLHRFITNCPADKVPDHEDGNTLNNRKYNLRICTYSQNSQNRKGATVKNRVHNTPRNVHFNITKNTYRVTLMVLGKLIQIGEFRDINIAEQHAINARKKYMTHATR